MKNLTILFCLIFIGCSSSSRYGFWDISKFKLVPTALESGSEIKILYSYRGPTNGEKKDWYNHSVVLSVKTGDTLNLLTMAYPEEDYDKNKTYHYLGPHEIITKMSSMDSKEIAATRNWDSVQIKIRSRVCRDKKFDYIADNQFPTVIGSIGMLMPINTDKKGPLLTQ